MPEWGPMTAEPVREGKYARIERPAATLSKTRLSVPPLGIDIFDPPLHCLVLAEAEFTTGAAARSFLPPPQIVAEVTDDPRFTGGSLVHAHRDDLLGWLADYGITPAPDTARNA
ncbi:hypothetical protein TPA0907_13910 [Micromonospora humidisoli]|nr:hypothetical protein TPA0907_13910 [Micromonospora sp. AKA109]